MGPFLIVAVIFVISSILQRATQKKTTSQPQTQRRQHPAFEETVEPKTQEKPITAMRHAPTVKPTVQSREHTVKPFTETEHRHMETSLTGISDCTSELSPLVTVNETIKAASEMKAGLKVNLTSQNLAQAILCSEILGKPKALRR